MRKVQADKDKAAFEVAAALARLDVAKRDRPDRRPLGVPQDRRPVRWHRHPAELNTKDFLSTAGKLGLFSKAGLDPTRVVIQVREANAGLVAERLPGKLTVQALSGPKLTVTHIS